MSYGRKQNPLYKQVDSKAPASKQGVSAGCLLVTLAIVSMLVGLLSLIQ